MFKLNDIKPNQVSRGTLEDGLAKYENNQFLFACESPC